MKYTYPVVYNIKVAGETSKKRMRFKIFYLGNLMLKQ